MGAPQSHTSNTGRTPDAAGLTVTTALFVLAFDPSSQKTVALTCSTPGFR